MKFDLIAVVMDPFILMFLAVAIGLILGKIKFGKFNIGTSGTLFSGLILGWIIYKLGKELIERGEGTAGYEAAVQMINNGIIHPYFFNASLIFFVATVGLLAAKDMGAVLKKYGVKFIALGLLITLVGAIGTYGATFLIDDTNSYEIAGVYTGALTSSPGLAAALETAKEHATDYAEQYEKKKESVQQEMLLMIDPTGTLTPENTHTLTTEQRKTYITNAEAGVGVGHAIGYPFGVIIVIFAVNFFGKVFKMDLEKEKRRFDEEMKEARTKVNTKNIPETSFSLISFALTCIIGYIVGSIDVYMGPLGYFSLGATGGVLIMGLWLGYIGKIGPVSFRMEPKTLTLIREISLAFFLGIVGLKYGFKAFDALLGSGVALALTSLLVGVLAILAGFLVGRYVFKLNWIMLVGAICGGMTSTPGLGAAIDALDSDDPAAGYGATYPFALLGMIIFTIVLHRVPIL